MWKSDSIFPYLESSALFEWLFFDMVYLENER